FLAASPGDRLLNRFPCASCCVASFSMSLGFPLFLLFLYTQFTSIWTWVFLFLACFCLFFNTGPTNTILANVTHPSIRASAFALNILVIHSLGDVISPLIIGIITDASGKNMNVDFRVVSATILLGGLLGICRI